jgi:hypothetical protein
MVTILVVLNSQTHHRRLNAAGALTHRGVASGVTMSTYSFKNLRNLRVGGRKSIAKKLSHNQSSIHNPQSPIPHHRAWSGHSVVRDLHTFSC